MRLLVVNPFASSVTEEGIEQVARALGDVEIRRTEHRGHATELAREARGAEAVYVFSGDGGYNEVLNGIDSETPVGFVPGGGANVLPRALGLPGDAVRAAEQLVAGRTRRISLGRVNGRRFGFAAGIGIDAEAIRRHEARGRSDDGSRAGNAVFAWELVRMLAERRGRFEPALEILGRGRVAFALVANGDPYTYAGPVPVRIAPEARFELGLDLVAPRGVRPVDLPRLLVQAFLGRGQPNARRIVYGHDLDRIEVVTDAPMPLQADGEDLGDVTSAIFEAERGAALVLI
ncbi:MAG TPA: diacylglycerol kinase family protein [Gaiellaceae bacterium]|nr:diacylglycerol kinase family protein [Gaiellaceae bacterium]